MSEQKHHKVEILLGGQWGDEGKGKIIDLISDKYDIVCRCQGGSNAGHTVVVDGVKYVYHLIPCGIIHPHVKVVIGNGVVIHVESLIKEIEECEAKGIKAVRERIVVSDRAHIVLNLHQKVDMLIETLKGSSSIGTTGKGIGPCYSSKMLRNGLRICDLIGNFEEFERKLIDIRKFYTDTYPTLELQDIKDELMTFKKMAEIIRPMTTDVSVFLHESFKQGKKVLVEGANGCLLDIDFGSYPYVTSSNCNVGGVCTGLGISPQVIGEIGSVIKAYTTRVGGGPFPTELTDAIGEKIQEIGAEYGSTTGRKRRCGWLDLVPLRTSHVINGLAYFVLTKIDVLDQFDEVKIAISYEKSSGEKILYFPANLFDLKDIQVNYITFPGWKQDITGCKSYEEMPLQARKFIEFIEQQTGVPVRYIGIGKDRDQIIRKI